MTIRCSMRKVLVPQLLAACVAVSGPPAMAQQAASSCGADSSLQTQVLQVVRNILTSADPEPALAGLPPDSAAVVSDPRVCARAAQRINHLAGENRRDRAVYVVRVGQVWAVHDPTFRAGEWSPLVLFDTHWKLLKTLLAM